MMEEGEATESSPVIFTIAGNEDVAVELDSTALRALATQALIGAHWTEDESTTDAACALADAEAFVDAIMDQDGTAAALGTLVAIRTLRDSLPDIAARLRAALGGAPDDDLDSAVGTLADVAEAFGCSEASVEKWLIDPLSADPLDL
jgi:hypothetical protein